jgi:hypothetical protein
MVPRWVLELARERPSIRCEAAAPTEPGRLAAAHRLLLGWLRAEFRGRPAADLVARRRRALSRSLEPDPTWVRQPARGRAKCPPVTGLALHQVKSLAAGTQQIGRAAHRPAARQVLRLGPLQLPAAREGAERSGRARRAASRFPICRSARPVLMPAAKTHLAPARVAETRKPVKAAGATGPSPARSPMRPPSRAP